jgi:hypothetical protein
MIRQGDSLLLTDSTSGKALWLDTGGGGTPENYGGLPGDQVPCQFNTAGTYLVTATVTLPTSPVTYALDYLNIIVVSLVELKPIDIQVGYTRVQAVADSDYRTITPSGQLPNIYFTSNNIFLLTVTETVVSGTANLNMTPIQPLGNMFMLARLGSETGPALSIIQVNEFTLQDTAAIGVCINGNGVGTSTFTMHPYIPNQIFDFNMFAHSSTFLGGATSFTVNTSDSQSSLGEQGFQQVYNPTTGATDGVFQYTIEVPPGETMYCISTLPFQDSAPAQNGTGTTENGDTYEIRRQFDTPEDQTWKPISEVNQNYEAATGHYIKLGLFINGQWSSTQGASQWGWGIGPSPIINNYIQTLPLGEVDPNVVTDLEHIQYYWYGYPGVQNIGCVFYYKYQWMVATAGMLLLYPDLSFTSTTTSNRPDEDGVDICVQGFSNATWTSLNFGLNGAGKYAIQWLAIATTPDVNSPNTLDGRGVFAITQLINKDVTAESIGGAYAHITSNDKDFLDDGTNGGVQYSGPTPPIAASTEGTMNDPKWSDSPSVNLTDLKNAKAREFFKTYFMYRPDGNNSIYVTMEMMEWFWEGDAPNGWVLHGLTAGLASKDPSGNPSNELPQWKGKASDINNWVWKPAPY